MKKKPLSELQLKECAALKAIFMRKRKELGLTQEKAAEALGMMQGSFSHYLNGRNALNVDFAARVAKLLGVLVVDFSPRLAHEIYALATVNSEIPGVEDLRRHLIHSELWADPDGMGEDAKVAHSYPVGSYFRSKEELSDVQHLNDQGGLFSSVNVSPRSYWHKVTGPSMCAPKTPSFPEGMMVLIDRDDYEVISGKFYAFRGPSGEETFKQLVIDSGRKYMSSLNPTFPPIEVGSEWTILGIAADARMIDL